MYITSLIVSTIGMVKGHGFPKVPRSRGLRAAEENIAYQHNGLNRKATADNTYGSGLCGVPNLHPHLNYDTILNGVWKSEASYTNGQEIDITSVISAYHGGHIEIGACADSSPTQECFDENKLTYIGGGHPKDENFPLRAYLGGWAMSYVEEKFEYKHRFHLPAGLYGDQVLLQWRYFTASSCIYEGYENYFAPYGGYAPSSAIPFCDMSVIDDIGISSPERFWGCMEVSIAMNPSFDTPNPPDSSESYMYPLDGLASFCGGGYVGSGVCANESKCCTTSGWCGNCSPSTPPPTKNTNYPSPTASPPATPPTDYKNLSPIASPPATPPTNLDYCCSWYGNACGGAAWCDDLQSNCEACNGQWILTSP